MTRKINGLLKHFTFSMRAVRAGIVANEFFESGINRVGGFGWAARKSVNAFRSDSRYADSVFYSGGLEAVLLPCRCSPVPLRSCCKGTIEKGSWDVREETG